MILFIHREVFHLRKKNYLNSSKWLKCSKVIWKNSTGKLYRSSFQNFFWSLLQDQPIGSLELLHLGSNGQVVEVYFTESVQDRDKAALCLPQIEASYGHIKRDPKVHTKELKTLQIPSTHGFSAMLEGMELNKTVTKIQTFLAFQLSNIKKVSTVKHETNSWKYATFQPT